MTAQFSLEHIFDLHLLLEALQITALVFVMMVVIDWIDVLTKGKLHEWVSGHRFQQYMVAGFLGVTPGCMGSYMNVSLYMHGFLSMGAIVGGMIATSGEASFVMFAKFPVTALIIHVLLLVLGVFFAGVTDLFARRLGIHPCEECDLQVYHPGQKSVKHYLTTHLWEHIVKRHIIRIFLWTFIALLLVHTGMEYFDLEGFAKNHVIIVLLIAALLGIIPDAAPQYIFIFMFSSGIIPFSVLLTSSIVQDGHGLLPLLSYSVRDSLIIKLFNVLYGLIAGFIVLWLGF